jgi:hypothetical protein
MATFGNFVAGQVLTAAELNAGLEYVTYTPTWTQSATITKTVNWARFTQFGKFVQVSIKMTATSNGISTNAVLIGLPVAASSDNFLLGSAHFTTSSATAPRWAIYNNSTTMRFSGPLSTSPFDINTSLTTQISSGDVVNIQITYEAA